MSAQDEIDRLRRAVEALQLSKLELIRSTSAEIGKMRCLFLIKHTHNIQLDLLTYLSIHLVFYLLF